MRLPRTPRRPFVATTFVLLALLAACAGWRRPPASSDMETTSEAAADRPPSVFLTGETAGFLSPCGCEMGQYGGLARRGAYLRAVRRPGDLTVDLGNLVTGDTPAHKVILEYSLEGLRTLGYDALVPGEGEIRLGRAFEEALARHPGPRVICANLFRADGKRAFDPWIVKTLPDGRRVAVVGIADNAGLATGISSFGGIGTGVNAQYFALTPDDGLRAALAELSGKADAVVVATSLSAAAARALAAGFPSVSLVVAGRAAEGSRGLVSTSGAPLLLVGEFGWYVARADLDRSLAASDARQAWLDERVPDDPDAAGLVARFKAEMSQDGEFSSRLVSSLRRQSYVGSEDCASCHAAEFATWKASGHAHAMRTLVAKKAQLDMGCIACHLVDVPPPAAPGAAESDTFETVGIGCEACHGGGARHADLARRGEKAEAVRALAPATREACLRCHFPPNSTHFEFGAYWAKIAHGKTAPR